jgi:aminoglycoside phosphotransferase (APT) family kinase protein
VTPADWMMLVERFDLGAMRRTPAYVARGAMGEIWQLETTQGRWAVKWQFPWAPTDARPYDLQVQRSAASAGIPLPPPVTTLGGDGVIPVGDRHARVYEWVELGPALRPPVGEHRAAQVGRLLGILHGLSMKAEVPVDPWYTEAPLPGVWATLADRARAAGAAWGTKLADASALIEELTTLVAPAPQRPPVICHRDFGPANVIPATPGGQLVVLDWENAGPLDAGRELGYVLLTWTAASGQFAGAAADALFSGYAAASGRDPQLEAGDFTTAVAVHLNFLRVMADQAIGDPAHRRYAERQIASLLDRDLDRLRRGIALVSASLHLDLA